MKRVLAALGVLAVLAGCRHEEKETDAPLLPQLQMRCTSGDVTGLTHEEVTFNGWVSVDGAGEDSRVEAGFWFSEKEGDADALMASGRYVEGGPLPSSGGGFKAQVSGLEPQTRYFYMAAAVCDDSLAVGSVRSFTTEELPKDLSVTGGADALTEFSVRLCGYVYPREDTGEFRHGLELSRHAEMTDSTVVFASVLDDDNAYYAVPDTLFPGTEYFYRAFVLRGEDEYNCGEVKSFKTLPVEGRTVSVPAGDVSEFKALLSGRLELQTTAEVERRAWLLLGRDPELSSPDSLAATLSDDGTFSFPVDTLTYGQTYYFAAVAAAAYGGYFEEYFRGDTLSFDTVGISPVLETRGAEDITEFKATMCGNLEPGNKDPMEISVWFMYGTAPGALTRKVEAELGEDGSFRFRLQQLAYACKYYYKACCRICDREFEADVASFETLDITAKVTTMPISAADEFGATLEAVLSEVSNDSFQKDVWFLYGKEGMSAAGLVSGGRKVQSSVAADGTFSAALENLDYGATYSYMACAKVYDKVFYGDVLSFTTEDIDADVVTGGAFSVTEYGATLTGELEDRADDRFNKGIYFFYSPSASSVSSLKNLGVKVKATYLGDGSYEAAVTDLVPDTEYFYVAYFRVFDAEFFGEVKSFTTLAVTAEVSTPGAADVSYHRATLTGNVVSMSNPSLSSTVWFLYGDSASQENWTRVSSSLSSGSFTAQISGLESGRTYYYTACINVAGYEFRSPVTSFDTRIPPEGSVDLGLSVCWSSCNYGADVPSGAGTFVNWNGAVAAAVAEGLAPPSYDQLEELRKNCTWTWTALDDVPGYLVTGRNGNSIFLPRTGHYTNVGTDNEKFIEGDSGLWSSMTRSTDPSIAFYLRFNASGAGMSSISAASGYPVRLVYD